MSLQNICSLMFFMFLYVFYLLCHTEVELKLNVLNCAFNKLKTLAFFNLTILCWPKTKIILYIEECQYSYFNILEAAASSLYATLDTCFGIACHTIYGFFLHIVILQYYCQFLCCGRPICFLSSHLFLSYRFFSGLQITLFLWTKIEFPLYLFSYKCI